MMRSLTLFALFCISFVYSAAQAQTLKKHTDKRTGIEICFSCDSNTFPAYWTGSEIAAACSSLDAEERKRSLSLITHAMNKYPAAILKGNIRKVYVLKSIAFYGLEYGGTNSSDAVYVTNNGVALGYSDTYIEKAFHHEFSSILLRNFRIQFDTSAWQLYNGSPYGQGGVSALKTASSDTEPDSVYWQQGFFYQYAQSDIENDFNSFAENLFLPHPSFWEVTRKYPALQNKLHLIIAFYNRLNPVFTRDYFYTIEKEADVISPN